MEGRPAPPSTAANESSSSSVHSIGNSTRHSQGGGSRQSHKSTASRRSAARQQRAKQKRQRQRHVVRATVVLLLGLATASTLQVFEQASRQSAAVVNHYGESMDAFVVLNSILNLTTQSAAAAAGDAASAASAMWKDLSSINQTFWNDNHKENTTINFHNNHDTNITMMTTIVNPNNVSDWDLVQNLHELLPLPRFQQPTVTNASQPWAALCVLAKGEDHYIDEWTIYHQALGFAGIYIYDKSENHTLSDFAKRQHAATTGSSTNVVQVLHSPRHAIRQNVHYDMCIHQLRLLPHPPKWLALLDVDEFLATGPPHTNIVDFLTRYLQKGAYMVNWWMVGTSNRTVYEPLPVTLRFQHRLPVPSHFTKPIMVLDHVLRSHVHFVYMQPGHRLKAPGTGRAQKCAKLRFCVNKPDLTPLSIFHFKYKSIAEFQHRKCSIGEVHVPLDKTPHKCAEATQQAIPSGTVRDDRPWQLLRHNAPAYVLQFWVVQTNDSNNNATN